ncbi:MAG: NADAR family protein [Pseudomonadota bacterium]
MDLPRNVEDLRACVRDGRRFHYRLFYGHKHRPEDVLSDVVFSQFYPCLFELDGQTYYWAEQWMMASKARAFGDRDAEMRILAAQHPLECKHIGRQVRDFDDKRWKQWRYPIVLAGNYAKFSQDADFSAYMVGTGDAVLVEAAPTDRIWGIGLSRTAADAQDPLKWRGQNLLGFALMDVRSMLLGDAPPPDPVRFS